MNVELKTVKLTKSKLLQMEDATIADIMNFDVLGFVVMASKYGHYRLIILKQGARLVKMPYTYEPSFSTEHIYNGNSQWSEKYPVKYKFIYGRKTMSYKYELPTEKDATDFCNRLKDILNQCEEIGQIYY